MAITTPAKTRPAGTPVALSSPTLLLLGRGVDRDSERGVECPGALPLPSDPSLVERAIKARETLGDKVFILGHHYQRDEVIQFADVTGDSFKLARDAANRPDSPYIIFCGVHFMAESADILTSDAQQVILPDMAAGCSMADMAAINQVRDCWDVLEDAGVAAGTIPVTYMNSSADIKAFTGAHGGDDLHVEQRQDRHAVELRAWRAGPVPARPAPGPEHRGPRTRPVTVRLRGLRPASPQRRPHHRAVARREGAALAGALLGARPVPARARRHDPARRCRASPCSCTRRSSTR